MAGKKKSCKQRSSSSFSSSSRKLICPTCGYVTFLKARFTKHVKYHSMPFIKCEFCDFRTQYTWNLDRHMKNHNSLGKMECPLCNFTCDMKQSLTSHVQNHHANVPEEVMAEFRTSCPTKSPNPGSRRESSEYAELDFYQDQDKEQSPEGVAPAPKRSKAAVEPEDRSLFMKKFYKCKFCNFNALSELALNRHVVQKHSTAGGIKNNPNLLQTMKVNNMPTLHKNVPEISSNCSSGFRSLSNVMNTKPMPNLIPIPKSNLVVAHASPHNKSTSSLLNTIKQEQSNNSYQAQPAYSQSRMDMDDGDKGVYDDDKSKVQFLQNLGLSPNPPIQNRESYASLLDNCQKSSYSSKKVQPQRRTSFFEKLSKKLTTNNITNLSQSSSPPTSVSDSIMETKNSSNNNGSSIISITSNSTRCQYCRHRCKTSADLINHLELCEEAQRFLVEEEENEGHEIGEQQIFIWNNGGAENAVDVEEEEESNEYIKNEEYFHNFDGFSGLTLDLENDGDYEEQMSSPTLTISPRCANVTKSRKVYKCPQKDCEFWATTASRFHVHVVGHYNTKPFECSQCSYRSNWRWDITKHIKLKTMRDPSHTKAKVLLTHKSGERNYRKYDRYLVPMAVTYSADAKLPDCSTVASKRPDVELDHSPSPPKSSPSPKSSGISTNRSKSPNVMGLIMSMPKLTKAPIQRPVEGSYSSLRQALNSDSVKISPMLPILKPIITISPMNSNGRTFVEKRMLAGGEILQNMESLGPDITVTSIRSGDGGSNSLQLSEQTKAPVTWKCKKCHFKHTNKKHVIHHINEVHKPKTGEAMSILSQNNLIRLGQAGQEGKLLRFQDIRNVSTKERAEIVNPEETELIEYYEKYDGVYACAYCHEEFSSTREVQKHIPLHLGVDQCAPLIEEIGNDDNCDISSLSGLILPDEVCVKPRGSAQLEGFVYKKYHCQECPYVTDSKGQFIYHKKFHVASPNSPYKCTSCSYRVSHKHLLQQHIRVHQDQNHENHLDHEEEGLVSMNDETLSTTSSRPRVLVWKEGKPYSVVRCRFCPQVFVSGKDVIEHERQHDETHGSDEDKEEDYDDDKVLNLSMKSDSNSTKLEQIYKDVSTHHVQNSANQIQPNKAPYLYLCEVCPARFLFEKEIRIHNTFHERKYEFACTFCSYSARQEVPHLMSHMKVHSSEYQDKTQSMLQYNYIIAPKLKDECSGESKKVSNNSGPPLPSLRNMKPVSITPKSSVIKTDKERQASSPLPECIPCMRCPARFSTFVSFLQHLNHHGKNTQFNCKHCDFGAESKYNLMLHSILHAGSEVTIEPDIVNIETEDKEDPVSYFEEGINVGQIPTVVPGADGESNCMLDAQTDFSVVRTFQGNPDFQYPTFVKNGRVKSKRYKCFKCPSAFEKRDQYKVHMGLHGSDQRYKCTVCDYSVTYYANFIQHLKKHENQPNVKKEQLIATPLSRMSKIGTTNSAGQCSIDSEENKTKVVPPLVLKVPKTAAQQQKLVTCSSCPFKTENASTLAEHETFHGRTYKEKCPFCNFSSNDKELLKGHLRVHFDTDFQPASPSQNSQLLVLPNKSDDATSPDSTDSEVDDYEAAVKRVNKKKIFVRKPGIFLQ